MPYHPKIILRYSDEIIIVNYKREMYSVTKIAVKMEHLDIGWYPLIL